MTQETKSLILKFAPYILLFYVFNQLSDLYHSIDADSIAEHISELILQLDKIFETPMVSFSGVDLMVGFMGSAGIYLIVYIKGKNAKKFRKGIEYGSARWGTAKDIKPYIDNEFERNILLTQNERLMMNSRPKNPKYARNKNVLVVGGSGSGKTRFFVKPNLMQMHSSYVVTDPKGTLLVECGKLLARGRKVLKNGVTSYEPFCLYSF